MLLKNEYFLRKFFTENWKFTGYIFTKSVPPLGVVIRTEHPSPQISVQVFFEVEDPSPDPS